MISSYSPTAVCNLALGWLGANEIASLDDTTDVSKEAILCRANYDFCRLAVLESRAWVFAGDRRSLSQAVVEDAVLDAHPNEHPFSLPIGTVTVLSATKSVRPWADTFWYREGDLIWAESEELYIERLIDVEDPAKWSPGFLHAFAARIAMDLCIPLTQSKEMLQLLAAAHGGKLDMAGTLDGLQGKNRPMGEANLIRVR